MTTKLTANMVNGKLRPARAVRRETGSVEPRSRRPFIVELCEGGHLVRIREKGRRTAYSVTYYDIWLAGARNVAIALKQAKLLNKGKR